jgi:hypothetical protein
VIGFDVTCCVVIVVDVVLFCLLLLLYLQQRISIFILWLERGHFRVGLEYAPEHPLFSHREPFLKAKRGNKQVNKYITT